MVYEEGGSIWFMIRGISGAFSRWARTNESAMARLAKGKIGFGIERHLPKDGLLPESDFVCVFILRRGFLSERR
jgi:hypothetical protein